MSIYNDAVQAGDAGVRGATTRLVVAVAVGEGRGVIDAFDDLLDRLIVYSEARGGPVRDRLADRDDALEDILNS